MEVHLASKLKIISWNVNSLRAREPLVQRLIQEEKPDIICLQELKIDDKIYVSDFFKPYSYNTISQNQKSYNGVSISYQEEMPIKDISFSELNKLQARNNVLLLEKKGIALVNNYFPNGNPIDTEKFSYKINWMDLLYNQIKQLKKNYEVIITGDFNVIPRDEDAHDIKKYRKLRNVHNRVSAVWLSLKRYYEQSGCNYGTYESMKFIETTYAINEKHQIYKKFQYHIDEKADLLKSLVWISEGFDSDKVKNILIL